MSFDIGIATEEESRTAVDQGGDPDKQPGEEPVIPDLDQALERLEKELIIRALTHTGGNQAKAARALRITDRIMGLRVRKYAIDPRQFRPSPDNSGQWI